MGGAYITATVCFRSKAVSTSWSSSPDRARQWVSCQAAHFGAGFIPPHRLHRDGLRVPLPADLMPAYRTAFRLPSAAWGHSAQVANQARRFISKQSWDCKLHAKPTGTLFLRRTGSLLDQDRQTYFFDIRKNADIHVSNIDGPFSTATDRAGTHRHQAQYPRFSE